MEHSHSTQFRTRPPGHPQGGAEMRYRIVSIYIVSSSGGAAEDRLIEGIAEQLPETIVVRAPSEERERVHAE